ncbi:putative methyltransferase [gamma proteobacterium HTCC5015]|nr:putative methyltransferase [gamma proteobacterium HTCC5015]
MSRRKVASAQAMGQVRVIAGEWRGRRLPVAEAPGLRPSGDAVRETLFNWLAPHILGARCLDAFAGSGALGFEAASRGAAQVDLVEYDRKVARQLEKNCEMLNAQNISVHCQRASDFLTPLDEVYDVVFLDPPFADRQWLSDLPRWLECCVAKQGVVYIEQAVDVGLPALPAHWRYRREQRRGRVVFGLAVDSRYTDA